VPINKTILQNPTYLTKEELKRVFETVDKRLQSYIEQKVSHTYIYATYMLRAAVHMLYATALRNAELRSLQLSNLNWDVLNGMVHGKG